MVKPFGTKLCNIRHIESLVGQLMLRILRNPEVLKFIQLSTFLFENKGYEGVK